MVFTHKHIVNAPTDLVIDSLEGLCALNPQVALDAQNKVIYQSNQDRAKVALICGGGSGHEPAHAGFVGTGMLTAAVCGNVFASPNASQVKHAINLVDNQKGTLIIVKNYTGDVLCFGLSREQYLATQPKKSDQVKFLVVGDDVAVGKDQGSIVGRRGLAGTVLVYKIAGALADKGSSLKDVYGIAAWVSSRLATIGCGLEHCHVPGTAIGESTLGATEIEIGLGIHNEPGFKTLSPVPSRRDLIKNLLDLLTSTSDPDRSFVPFSGKGDDEVVLMVNNLGGLSELELGGIARETVAALSVRHVHVQRLLVGTFMTSLNMPGFSLTLLLLPKASDLDPCPVSKTALLDLLDAKADTPGWKWSSAHSPEIRLSTSLSSASTGSGVPAPKLTAAQPHKFTVAIEKACRSLIAEEPEITRLDSIVGDGDCGLTLKGGAEAVLQELSQGSITGDDVIGSVVSISRIAEEKMGGTSGALYSIFFSSLAQGLTKATTQSEESVVNSQAWVQALSHSLESLYHYTRARPPSRTLIDPLAAFITSLEEGNDVTTSVKAAGNAADLTAEIEAKAGRSAYVEGKHLKGVADPGALGVKLILAAILQA